MDLLRLFKADSKSYYGTSSYKYVDKFLKREKNLLIVSPYIDDFYAKYLSSVSNGKKMYILSSSIKESERSKLQTSSLSGAIWLSLYLFAVNYLLFSINYFVVYIALLSVAVSAFAILRAARSKRNVFVRSPRRFVHIKMYIGDYSAIAGTANLTYAGMHKNVEQINMISDPSKIAEMRREFWKLWNSTA